MNTTEITLRKLLNNMNFPFLPGHVDNVNYLMIVRVSYELPPFSIDGGHPGHLFQTMTKKWLYLLNMN